MRLPTLTVLCPALLLLALTWVLAGLRAPLPTGDEATSVLMVQSLWHDRDTTFREDDLARSIKIWDGGPSGLTLFTDDGGRTMRYGRPLAYPLAALPFYGVFGLRGIALFNMALFLAMAGAALWHFREETGGLSAGGGLFVAGFFFASAAFAYAFRMEPEVFLMACAFFPLFLWRRESLAGLAVAGALIGAALTSSPLLALLGLPILIDLILKRRFRGVLIFLASLMLVAGGLSLLQKVGTKEWTAFGGAQRRTFVDEFPLETPRDLWQGYSGEGAEPRYGAAKLLPRNLGYVLAGRYTGLLPYFPFALFALGLYLFGSKDRSRHLLLGTLLIYIVAALLLHPRGFAGDPGFLGSRYLAIVYPAFLFLPKTIPARRSLALPFVAAGLWTAAAVIGSLSKLAPEAPLQLHAQARSFQRLPLELTLLPGESLPGFIAQTWGDALWIFPGTFFAEERHPHGVWVRGSTRSEVIVVSPKPLSRLSFLVYSLAADNELILTSNADRFRVRFDSEGKRNGTPVELAVEPVARNLGLLPRDHFYRFTLETTGGFVPSRYHRKSADPRNLGVFLDFTGEGY
jgi:hypothetical protein